MYPGQVTGLPADSHLVKLFFNYFLDLDSDLLKSQNIFKRFYDFLSIIILAQNKNIMKTEVCLQVRDFLAVLKPGWWPLTVFFYSFVRLLSL